MLFLFHVFDLNNSDQLRYGKDQEFPLAKTHAVAILNELLAGHYDLEITRHGTGNFDTRYEVRPIITTTTTAPAPAA